MWLWIVAAIAAVLLLFFASPFIALAALIVLITAIVGLARRTPTWLHLRSTGVAVAVVAASAVVLLVSDGVNAAVISGGAAEVSARSVNSGASREPAQMRPSVPTPTSTPTRTPVTTTREEVVTEVIPFERATMDDLKTTRGETWVATVGVDGVRTMTYSVTLVYGIETGRALASDVVTTAPVTEVTAVGSYDPPVVQQPQAQPASGGCDPNYADACVPISSDVDCAGGSGNGAAYFSGVARVVGADIYDLDRDNDGYACER